MKSIWFILLSSSILKSLYAMEINLVTIEQAEYQHVLKTKAQPVTFPLTAEDKQLITAMKTKLKKLGGVGLAAPQINHPKQIIVMYIPEEATLLRDNVEIYPLHVMLNPSYEPINLTEQHADYEGCYSVSSKAGKVPRYSTIKLTWYDEQGQQHQSMEHGFYARVLQHEVDHLNGILIIDRLTPDCVQGTPTEMAVLRRAELPENKRILFDKVMARKLKAKD